MAQRRSGLEYLAEVLHDSERAFYEMGPVWGSPPRLFEAKLPPARSVHSAVLAMLDHIESRGDHAEAVRAILAASQLGTEHAVNPGAVLFGLPHDLLQLTLRLFAWVAASGGITLDDFEDGGARFVRAVHREQSRAAHESPEERKA